MSFLFSVAAVTSAVSVSKVGKYYFMTFLGLTNQKQRSYEQPLNMRSQLTHFMPRHSFQVLYHVMKELAYELFWSPNQICQITTHNQTVSQSAGHPKFPVDILQVFLRIRYTKTTTTQKVKKKHTAKTKQIPPPFVNTNTLNYVYPMID